MLTLFVPCVDSATMFNKLVAQGKRKVKESSSTVVANKASKIVPHTGVVVDNSPPPAVLAYFSPVVLVSLPPLAPSQLSSSDSLVAPSQNIPPSDSIAAACGQVKKVVDFVSQHESIRGVPFQNSNLLLRGSMVDLTRASNYYSTPYFTLSSIFLTF